MSRKTGLETPLSVYLLSSGPLVDVQAILDLQPGDILPVDQVWQDPQIIFTFNSKRVIEADFAVRRDEGGAVLGVGLVVRKVYPRASWMSKGLQESLAGGCGGGNVFF